MSKVLVMNISCVFIFFTEVHLASEIGKVDLEQVLLQVFLTDFRRDIKQEFRGQESARVQVVSQDGESLRVLLFGFLFQVS